MKEKIFIVRRKKEGCFPMDYMTDFEIILESEIKETDIVLREISDSLIPESMKGIPSEDLVLFLSTLPDANIMFFDVREKCYHLAEKACWLKLTDLGVKDSVIGFLIPKDIDFSGENYHMTKDLYWNQISLLGVLATFKRSQIAKLPGIGKKTMEMFDKLILENGLHWNFHMEAIKELGQYY